MIIISWDVGIIHLAYTILEENNGKVRILEWDEVNLLEDRKTDLWCGGFNKKGGACQKKAVYSLEEENGELTGFCKTHVSQSRKNVNPKKFFQPMENGVECNFLSKTGVKCENRSTCFLKSLELSLCNKHQKRELQILEKKYSPIFFKKPSAAKYKTASLQMILIQKLDKLLPFFSRYKIREVIIENQPSYKNPKMKSMANTLFDYFLIRGYFDRAYGLEIRKVRFICPSNKLKLDENNKLILFQKGGKEKYKYTKKLSISYTKKLLENYPDLIQYLESYKKQDDLCDSYLQGLYYLKFLKS